MEGMHAGLDEKAAENLFKRAAATLKVRQPPPGLRHAYFNPWLKAAKEQDIKTDKSPLVLVKEKKKDRADVNAVTALANGRRRDSCTTYLTPVLRSRCRSNLKLQLSAVATQIVVQDGEAVGVLYRCV